MAWNEDQPQKSLGEPGKQAHLRLVGGKFVGLTSVPPPPDSYASDPHSELVIAILKLEPGAAFVLPPASSSDINRTLYFYSGSSVSVDGKVFEDKVALIKLEADREVEVNCTGKVECELLLLQGRPIDEPVVQHGPFVTNTREELNQVTSDYRKTQFGGWKWGRSDPVHPRSEVRFYNINGKRVDAPSSKA